MIAMHHTSRCLRPKSTSLSPEAAPATVSSGKWHVQGQPPASSQSAASLRKSQATLVLHLVLLISCFAPRSQQSRDHQMQPLHRCIKPQHMT